MSEYTINKIQIRDIDCDYKSYKISRNYIDDTFTKSIADFGILDPVHICNSDNSYRVLFGLNRITAALNLGIESITACCFTTPDPDQYYRTAILKNTRGEIGPIGKLRLLSVIHTLFRSSPLSNSSEICANLSIPWEFADTKIMNTVLSEFSINLLDYIDVKDPGFKIIKMLLNLPVPVRDLISEAAGRSVMKVNIFRSCVEMAYEINKKNGDHRAITEIKLDHDISQRERGEDFHHQLYKLRYPSYYQILSEVDSLLKSLNSSNIKVEFPRNLERNDLEIKFTFNKHRIPEEALRALGLDPVSISRLLSFL